MPESLIVKTKRDGTITFEDGTAVPNTFTVSFEAGDLSVTIPGPAIGSFLDRGQFSSPPSLRYTDDAPCTGSFTAYLRDYDDGGTGTETTLAEIITQSGVAATWVSTLDPAGNAEVFCLNLKFVIEGTDHGDPTDHEMVLSDCAISGSIAEGDPDTISLSFTSYALYPVLT